MTITDNYKRVNITAAQEIRAGDLSDISSFLHARLVDQVLASLIPGINVADPEFTGQMGVDAPSVPYAFALRAGGAYLRQGSANNKVQIAPGTLLQKIAAADGSTPQLLSFTFGGTDELTITNGDATNPRVDLVQMKLSLVNTDQQTRVTQTPATVASLNMATITTHLDTVFKSKVYGKSGNNISIATQKRASGVGVTYSEVGNAVTIQYQDGVSTVADVEAAVVANSTVLAIQTNGTGANVLSDPADSHVATNLAGGVDTIFSSGTPFMKTQVQCDLTVKQGAPAASPAYPDLDAGYVCIGAVVVGAAYAAAGGFLFEDSAGAVAVIHDQRIPLGIRPITVMPKDFIGSDADWTLQAYGMYIEGGASDLWIPCPAGQSGRLISIAAGFLDQGTCTSKISKFSLFDSNPGGTSVPEFLSTDLQNGLPGSSTAHYQEHVYQLANLAQLHAPAAGPVVVNNAAGLGPPLWTSGMRAPREAHRLGTYPIPTNMLGMHFSNMLGGTWYFGPARFFIAEGL